MEPTTYIEAVVSIPHVEGETKEDDDYMKEYELENEAELCGVMKTFKEKFITNSKHGNTALFCVKM